MLMEFNMRILGIDPGLQITGYGCVEITAESVEPQLVEAGVVRMPRSKPMYDRLGYLYEQLGEIMRELSPQQIVVEQLFSHYKHVQTSILMGHARGVVLLAGHVFGATFHELAPNEIKKAITGHGHATKLQMQHAIMAQCNLSALPEPPDVADAIGIALCAARRLETQPLAAR